LHGTHMITWNYSEPPSQPWFWDIFCDIVYQTAFVLPQSSKDDTLLCFVSFSLFRG